eukprot:TRINITY_DN3912_c0_g1_i1.p1 TRINITY_DN3912_c0_g1~~TRINITY_DN3912_c0_g1_i1.p1  ORF type:complete len:182 (+),score=9.66 TRINITY_DN3912_c0_g1_i1:76-546(+)
MAVLQIAVSFPFPILFLILGALISAFVFPSVNADAAYDVNPSFSIQGLCENSEDLLPVPQDWQPKTLPQMPATGRESPAQRDILDGSETSSTGRRSPSWSLSGRVSAHIGELSFLQVLISLPMHLVFTSLLPLEEWMDFIHSTLAETVSMASVLPL